jgi:hypothetical protein
MPLGYWRNCNKLKKVRIQNLIVKLHTANRTNVTDKFYWGMKKLKYQTRKNELSKTPE